MHTCGQGESVEWSMSIAVDMEAMAVDDISPGEQVENEQERATYAY